LTQAAQFPAAMQKVIAYYKQRSTQPIETPSSSTR
jgi:hypothetical protein